ncbi:MAG: acyl carrier protein [Alphaproteobacteria bacterium]|nr:acyl carrier protein [Alphaproteobacteria bacterium]
MTVEDIKKKVIDIVVKQIGADADKVTMESKIIDDLGADSLDRVELTMAVEDEFGIQIPDVDAEKLITIGDVAQYIIDHS